MRQKVKGTYDILPEESVKWQKIEKEIRELCDIYNFNEIRIPIFEYTDVFTGSIGEETDIVTKEMYSFLTRSNKSVTLRPEGTAGVVRCYAENKIYGRENISRWYYIGPMFRAERPQKGRQRQFHQFGIEIIGSDSPICDAEVILINLDLFKRLGLKNLTVKINSLGNENCRPAYVESLKEYFKDKLDNLCEQCRTRYEKNILRMLDCKVGSCQEILNSAPSMEEFLDDESKEHFEKVKELLGDVEYVVDKRLVRGLDYYTRTAFEITSSDLGSQDSLAGGGRYDKLVESFSGKQIPAVGSAIGLERLIIALDANGSFKDISKGLDLYIAYFDKEHTAQVFNVLRHLRDCGLSVRMSEKTKKIGAQLKDADRLGAKNVIIIGENEISTNKFSLKNLETGEQNNELTLDDIVKRIKI